MAISVVEHENKIHHTYNFYSTDIVLQYDFSESKLNTSLPQNAILKYCQVIKVIINKKIKNIQIN